MFASFSRIAVWLIGAVLALTTASACNDRTLAVPDGIVAHGDGDPDPNLLPDDDDLHRSDVDDDDVPNAEDNCPATLNPGQEDGDGDGVGDACDDCPTVSDPEQPDEDENNVGDACQPLCPDGDDLC